MPASLPETDAAGVYVIHEMHLPFLQPKPQAAALVAATPLFSTHCAAADAELVRSRE